MDFISHRKQPLEKDIEEDFDSETVGSQETSPTKSMYSPT